MKDLNFSKGLVKSGTKNVSEVSPKLTLTSTYSNFKLNNKAMAALDVVPGDRVVMFDMKEAGAASQEERYYICKGGFTKDDQEQGSLVSKQRAFRYSGIYNTMLTNDFDLSSIAGDDLVEAGTVIKRESVSEETGKTTLMYIATKIGSADLTPVNDGEAIEVADGVERVLYLVSNIKFSDHTPKGGKNEDEPQLAVED